MNYEALFQKYSALLSENQKLQNEIKALKDPAQSMDALPVA